MSEQLGNTQFTTRQKVILALAVAVYLLVLVIPVKAHAQTWELPQPSAKAVEKAKASEADKQAAANAPVPVKALWLEPGYLKDSGKGSIALGGRYGMFGLMIGGADTGQYPASDVDELPDYFEKTQFKNFGRQKIDAHYGADALVFYDMSTTISLYGGAGVYVQEFANAYENIGYQVSNTAQQYYKADMKNKITAEFCGGAHYKLPLSFWAGAGKNLLLGAGYHTARGITFSLGVQW